MPHRKPTRDGSLVLKAVSHNYNHLSPRGDLGGQYLVHKVEKVLIGPSPLHHAHVPFAGHPRAKARQLP